MAKMSKTQRTAILDFHNGVTSKAYTMLVRSERTLDVMVREGWATRVTRHTGYVTRAGLIAAGVDMDAIHADAAPNVLNAEAPDARTVTVPDLTARLGFPPHEQAMTAAWAGVRHDHRWTEDEAADLIHIWCNPGTRHVGDRTAR
jgi:hypothetical protein